MILSKIFAITNDPNAPVDGSGGADLNLPQVSATADTIRNVLGLVFGIIAVVTVIYIIVAGFQFITSQGDPQQVAKARQTILFAVIGLAIALSAELIVFFVLGRI
jgi:TRAP-type C4-dicarboxylate transport system permease small subunit